MFIPRDPRGDPRGFAFITFEDRKDARDAAKEMVQLMLCLFCLYPPLVLFLFLLLWLNCVVRWCYAMRVCHG